MNCPTGSGCVAGPNCSGEPTCPTVVGCPTCSVATQNSHVENLQRLMENALRRVKSYSYSEESDVNTAFLSNCQSLAMDSSSSDGEDGYLDLREPTFRLSSHSKKADCSGKSIDRNIDSYLIGDTLYICNSKEWTKQVISDPVRAIEERDQLRSMAKLIVGSKVEVLGNENVDGENCYKLKFVPDTQFSQGMLTSLALAARSESPVALPETGMDLLAEDNNLLQNGEMSWTAWISAQDYLPRKVESEMKFMLMPELLHPPEGASDLRVKMTSGKTINFKDFGKKKLVELPADANSARAVQ